MEEQPTATGAAHGLDPDSRAWLAGLAPGAPDHDHHVGLLHAMLLRVARAEASRRSAAGGVGGRELDDLAHQAADDALVSVLRKVEGFRGDSRFTTWAYKFAVLEVAGKLARHAWRRGGVPVDDRTWDRLPERLGAGPEAVTEARDLVDAVREAVEQALTPHQRRVFTAIVVAGTPLDALVVELDTNRNAIYKTMFDARRKLRAHLVARGHLDTGTEEP